MEYKKILLTGASGFIGRNLKEHFEGKYDIYCPSSRELNLCNQEAVEEELTKNRYDVVIHSANTNTTKNQDITLNDSLDRNLRMFYNLERCKKFFGKMYYFGSGAEYDMRHYIPEMKEEYFGTFIPQDPYGFSKYIMSKSCREDENIYDLRLFGVYGKYEEWHRRFISNAICRVLKGMPITISQNVFFDYLWIEDLANIMEWFIENTPQHRHYNICTGSRVDLYTLACKVRQIMNVDCDIIVGKEGYKLEYTGNNQRMMDELGNYSFADLDITIQRLIDHYKTNEKMIDKEKLI